MYFFPGLNFHGGNEVNPSPFGKFQRDRDITGRIVIRYRDTIQPELNRPFNNVAGVFRRWAQGDKQLWICRSTLQLSFRLIHLPPTGTKYPSLSAF